MWRVVVLFLVVTVGCSKAPTSQGDNGAATLKSDKRPKESPSIKPSAADKNPEHDYRGWKVYAPNEAGFEMRFPKEPVVMPPSPATGDYHVASIARQAVEELGYVCQWKLREQPFGSKEAEAAFLKGQQIGLLKATKGRLLEEKDITLDGAQGRELIIGISDDDLFRSRTYLAGKLEINVQVWGKNAEALRSTDASKFLESLKLSK